MHNFQKVQFKPLDMEKLRKEFAGEDLDRIEIFNRHAATAPVEIMEGGIVKAYPILDKQFKAAYQTWKSAPTGEEALAFKEILKCFYQEMEVRKLNQRMRVLLPF